MEHHLKEETAKGFQCSCGRSFQSDVSFSQHTESFAIPSQCNHLRGTWERQGRFAIIKCENGDQDTIIDVDSEEAFHLFEGGVSAIQRFGKPPKCVTPDDEERLQEFIGRGLKLD